METLLPIQELLLEHHQREMLSSCLLLQLLEHQLQKVTRSCDLLELPLEHKRGEIVKLFAGAATGTLPPKDKMDIPTGGHQMNCQKVQLLGNLQYQVFQQFGTDNSERTNPSGFALEGAWVTFTVVGESKHAHQRWRKLLAAQQIDL